MRSSDPLLPVVVSRAQARRAGLTDRQITWRIEHGQWKVLRRNLFVTPRPAGAELGAEDGRLVAALTSTRREVVVGHAHAARLWGLPSPLGGWGDPVLLAADGPHRNRNGTRIVVTPLPTEDVVLRRGVLVTSPVRTVTDCLRVLPAVDALAIADAAARSLVAAPLLVAAVDVLGGWPGIIAARRVVGLVDGRRESPFESWSAWAFAATGLVMPLWQVDIADSAGFVGRGDAWWQEGVVGEADGKAKYRLRAAERGGLDAERLAQVLDAERRREQRIHRAGLTVVRWDAKDVLNPEAATSLTHHIKTQLTHPTPVPRTARVTPHPFRHPG